MSDEGLHKGHRKRMMKKFKNNGIFCMEEHEILEMVLYGVYSRRNTNDISHRLINRFGSLGAVFEASERELTEIEDVGENAADHIRLWGEVCRYVQAKLPEKVVLNSNEAIVNYCRSIMDVRSKETIIALFLDKKFQLLSRYTVSDGSYNSVSILIKEITEKAIKSNCSSIVFAHSHPGETAIPSSADVVTTRRIGEFLKHLDIRLNDHIIISPNSDYSMRSSELLTDIWS